MQECKLVFKIVSFIMFLIQEIRKKGFQVIANMPHVYCKAFEDNSGALELARLPKLRPRTKHINTWFHHFREHVRNGLAWQCLGYVELVTHKLYA